MTTAAEKFMTPAAQKPEALAWLEHVPQEAAPAWVQALRETGAEAFATTGLPTLSWEGWQYLNLRGLSRGNFVYSVAPVAVELPKPLLAEALRVVVVNGQFQPNLSDKVEGLQILGLMDAAKEDGFETWIARVGDLAAAPFRALNAAHLRDGLVVKVSGDVARPVEVLFFNTGDNVAIYPRVLYWLAPNAGATVLERHEGEGAYFTNMATDIVLENDSRFRFCRLMKESLSAHHFSDTNIQQHKGSSFEGFSLAAGALQGRQEFRLNLLDSGINTSICGIYVLKHMQNHDFTVTATHFEPRGKSQQYFKGVVDAQARAVYQGKIHVRRFAQETDGYQSHHALLLSGQAEARFKPELEIYADDVKCGHGATSGHLDPASLFYLRSRGIPEEEARSLLIESFLNDAADKISYAPIREIVQHEVVEWLKHRQS